MTRQQTFLSISVFATVISLFLLAVIVKIDGHLEESKLAITNLEKRINRLQDENQELKKSLTKINHTTDAINKDIDTTQELQRKQAQAILELKKTRKK